MIKELSILIPTYNSCCVEMARQLQTMCDRVPKPFEYEIIVADDGSQNLSAVEANSVISQLPHCSFLKKDSNTGSAATRNFLAKHSHYEWLLFLDSDMTIPDSDFIVRYLSHDQYDVVNGGISIAGEDLHSLRYIYEKRAEPLHEADIRNRLQFKEFRSTNFLVRRTLILQTPFDERFKKSGYEDVHWGRRLSEQHATIMHIDNPLVLDQFESNADYVRKCERNLQTLYQFRDELQGYSRLIDSPLTKPGSPLAWILLLWHRLFGRLEHSNLTGSSPSLWIFNLYKLGYFATLHTSSGRIGLGLLLLLAVVTTDCTKQKEMEDINAVYYWRTDLRLDSAERDFLQQYHINKGYCRYFDVVMNDEDYPMPNATITFSDSIPEGVELVPTVYITEDCMHKTYKGLAEKLVRRIRQMNETNHIDGVRELQIDCDFTAKSLRTYYSFLSEVRKAWDGTLSTTIRLHQLPMEVPPVDYGVLMVYNTGDPQKFMERNPILDLRDVKPYLRWLDGYTLPLAAAYPTFSWLRRIHGVEVTHTVEADEIMRVKQAVEEASPRLRHTIITYHLDNENINRYKPVTYEKIYHH